MTPTGSAGVAGSLLGKFYSEKPASRNLLSSLRHATKNLLSSSKAASMNLQAPQRTPFGLQAPEVVLLSFLALHRISLHSSRFTKPIVTTVSFHQDCSLFSGWKRCQSGEQTLLLTLVYCPAFLLHG